jgi:hypothetical protein
MTQSVILFSIYAHAKDAEYVLDTGSRGRFPSC